MLYVLPDGEKILLEDIVRISKVRDQGEDVASIEYSKLSFTIYLTDHREIEVYEQYHYADWAEKKKHLDSIYHDLVEKWKTVVGTVDTG